MKVLLTRSRNQEQKLHRDMLFIEQKIVLQIRSKLFRRVEIRSAMHYDTLYSLGNTLLRTTFIDNL